MKYNYILFIFVTFTIFSSTCFYEETISYRTSINTENSNSPDNTTQYLKAIKLASGNKHTCALLPDNTLNCWGDNTYGQLGNGTNSSSLKPVSLGSLSSIDQVVVGDEHTCALQSDQTVKCWGRNQYGQLGDGTNVNKNLPTSVINLANVSSITAGWRHNCAVLTDGSVKCWGYNISGQLGDNTTTNRNSPVITTDLDNFTQIDGGSHHTCAVLQDSSVKCWGNNFYGQVGNGNSGGIGVNDTYNSGVDSLIPVVVQSLNSAKLVGAGWGHSCALITDGTMKCWGNGGSGQLGDGYQINRTSPVVPSGINNVSDFLVGSGHTCSLMSNQTVKCWGLNISDGRIGIGTTVDYVINPTTVLDITTATAIYSEGRHSCAILTDKTIKCWGRNEYGQLGDGTTTNRLSPVSVVAE